ncbi:MAG TPA: DUF2334 domain-containing protein [Terracidiphilus sp.]|jgi:hypothetical protein
MVPKPAQYLLRFDDLCPTIHRMRWKRLRAVIAEYKIQPILAIVPDNQDFALEHSPNDPGFWNEMREMEAAGAAIAIHGYQHRCESRGKGLLGLHRKSEFAGVDHNTQRAWIREGVRILRGQGLNPRLWVAPRHGFDRNTLRALHQEGMDYISDGFARIPFKRGGLTWVPQQLWSPVYKSKGVWTICFHPCATSSSEVDRLRSFLARYASQFTSFDHLLKEMTICRLGLRETIHEKLALWRVQARHQRARRRRIRL